MPIIAEPDYLSLDDEARNLEGIRGYKPGIITRYARAIKYVCGFHSGPWIYIRYETDGFMAAVRLNDFIPCNDEEFNVWLVTQKLQRSVAG